MGDVHDISHRFRPPIARSEGPANARLARECRAVYAAVAAVKMLTEQDAERAARNLTGLLDEARRVAGVRAAAVARRVWGGRDADPSKRLYKLTLPRADGLSAHEARERSRRHRKHLQRHAAKYAAVAEALAEEMGGRPGWERQELLVRLFRDTAVDRKLGDLVASRVRASAEPDNCWRELASRIGEVAAWVAREADLHGHLARMASTRGCYNLAEDAVLPNSGLLLPHGPLHGNFEVPDEFPPVPSVPLFQELLADVPGAVLTLEAGGGAGPATLTVRARVWRELRLAVGPADVPEQPAALFEVRTRVDAETESGPIPIRCPWIHLPGWSVEVEIDGARRRGCLELGDEPPGGGDWRGLLAWPGFGGSADPLQPEHCYAAWRLATSETCEELLARRPAEPADEVWLFFEPPNVPTLAPEGSFGAAVEAAFVAEDGPRLDRELLREARRLVALVEAYAADRRRQAVDMHDRAAARWAAAGHAAQAPADPASVGGEPC